MMMKLVDTLCHPALLLMLDTLLCGLILLWVPYTEIDWKAYMQEVKGFVDGEYDYMKLKGDTGPLVYPAGFVYLYTVLYYITNMGTHIFLAQCIFALIYLCNTSLVMRLYTSCGLKGAVLIALLTSKRIHSIFVLRMFNDGVAIWFAYIAIFFMAKQNSRFNWVIGCAFYSLAVSIKMNIFLFAPAMLVILLKNHSLLKTTALLAVCGIIQVVLGAPFLAHNWWSYLSKAFELSRVFTYKWTVNYKFLPEDIFVSKPWGHALLLLTISSWVLLYLRRWRHRDLSTARGIVTTMFESNMVGVICARTMHYQFYSWFYHQLPLVLFISCTNMPMFMKISVLLSVEFAFNKYPSTAMSSAALMSALFLTLLFMLTSSDDVKKDDRSPDASSSAPSTEKKKKKKK